MTSNQVECLFQQKENMQTTDRNILNKCKKEKKSKLQSAHDTFGFLSDKHRADFLVVWPVHKKFCDHSNN